MEMNISVCIDMMYSYVDFYKRFEEVKNSGIDVIEFWKWSDKDIDRIVSKLNELNMKVSIFNLDCKDEKLSYQLSRGILNAGKKEEFIYALQQSMPVYKRLAANGLIVLVGENIEHLPYDQQVENIYQCLLEAKDLVEREGITLLVEPLNNVDRKNYFMPYAKSVMDILRKINSPNIKMLYDMYHQNMMGDFSLEEIKENIDIIGHFHVADCPGRHEVGTGKVDYVSILKEINKTDYNGYIGLEYRATKKDSETLEFLKEVYNV